MDLNDYQKQAHATANYKSTLYPYFGLIGEIGELFGHYAKGMRGDYEKDRTKIVAEAGDVLWELSEILTLENITLEEVAQYNLIKLKDRAQRNIIKGDGDIR